MRIKLTIPEPTQPDQFKIALQRWAQSCHVTGIVMSSQRDLIIEAQGSSQTLATFKAQFVSHLPLEAQAEIKEKTLTPIPEKLFRVLA